MKTGSFSEWARRFAQISGSLVAVAGGMVLLGWTIDSPLLKSVLPQWPKMAGITALAFVLSGVALRLASAAAERVTLPYRRLARRLSLGCAGLVLSIALARLIEILMGRSLVFDRLLFAEGP